MPNFLREDYGIRQAQGDSAAPTSGTYNAMDIVENSAPAAGYPVSWVCVTGGAPGTWRPQGFLPNLTAVAAASNVAATAGIVSVTGSGGYNVTLAVPSATDHSGITVNFVNTSSGTITAVAATGASIVGLPVAIATNTSGTFRAYGTNWYRV
jgi:hypothetical protein